MQLNRLIEYFIFPKKELSDKEFRKQKIFVSVNFVTIIYALAYLPVVVLERYFAAIPVILGLAFINLFLPFILRNGVPLVILANIYIAAFACAEIIILTQGGGVLGTNTDPQILALLPILALLFINFRAAIIWLCIGIAILVVFIQWELRGHDFPFLMDPKYVKMQNGLAVIGHLILFFLVINIFETQKNKALSQLAENSLLLAEEKRKTALYNISQELHDNIGQTLSLVKVNLHTAQLLKDESLQFKINDTIDLVAKAIQDLREISHNLNAENITEFNFLEAIKNQLDAIEKIGTYLTDFTLIGNYCKLCAQTEFILFRIVQEIINNIIKHSQAKSINIRIVYDAQQLSLTINDDGVGIDSKKLLQGGQGLRTMKSRADLIGGKFEIDSKLNSGTTINIQLPLKLNPDPKKFK